MTAHDGRGLPLPDYDELPLGALESRIRTLRPGQVRELLDHERSHARRVPVVEALVHRMGELDAGARPTRGDPRGIQPEHRRHRSGSAVSPHSSPDPKGPPPHGTPDQRGHPKGSRF
ncbi:hypothetical protein [Streptomyces sp. NPDC058045]|uniref:hypothetical protein n=1 Tax=Streptomyces sp. NPDC058045 TaxID=3346311 RepID=UPI0036EDFDEB